MAGFIKVADKNELKDGEMKQVDIDGRAVLLARAGDSYYAAAGRCPHLGGKLAGGSLDGTIVTCPLHGSRFDLVDGRVVRWTNFTGFIAALNNLFKSSRPLPIYKVKIENDAVLVEL